MGGEVAEEHDQHEREQDNPGALPLYEGHPLLPQEQQPSGFAPGIRGANVRGVEANIPAEHADPHPPFIFLPLLRDALLQGAQRDLCVEEAFPSSAV